MEESNVQTVKIRRPLAQFGDLLLRMRTINRPRRFRKIILTEVEIAN